MYSVSGKFPQASVGTMTTVRSQKYFSLQAHSCNRPFPGRHCSLSMMPPCGPAASWHVIYLACEIPGMQTEWLICLFLRECYCMPAPVHTSYNWAWALQAGRCGRCRAELGESGQVCSHCRLDERWLAWEMRLYSVHTRALVAGTAVSAEDALRQACLPSCRSCSLIFAWLFGLAGCFVLGTGLAARVIKMAWLLPCVRWCECEARQLTGAQLACMQGLGDAYHWQRAMHSRLRSARLWQETIRRIGRLHLGAESWDCVQAQAAALRRVGQGGLNEEAGEAADDSNDADLGLVPEDARRRNDQLISDTEVQRQPSEAEQAVRLLMGQLRLLRGLPASDAGMQPCYSLHTSCLLAGLRLVIGRTVL